MVERLRRVIASGRGRQQMGVTKLPSGARKAGLIATIGVVFAISTASCAEGEEPEKREAPPPDAVAEAGASDGEVADTRVAESCFNGVDDDGNGLVDCEDPACDPIATCVPETTDDFRAGATVELGEACPAHFDGEKTSIFAGLTSTGCVGCSCTAKTICSVTVYRYETGDACPGDVRTPIATITREISSDPPAGGFGGSGGPYAPASCITGTYGTRVGAAPAVVSATPCEPSGTATPAAPAFEQSAEFCAARTVGRGCMAGICVPKAKRHCMIAEGAKACPAGYAPRGSWFTGLADDRKCGECKCGPQTLGSCANVSVSLFKAVDCSGASFKGPVEGNSHCNIPASVGAQAASLDGQSEPPSCPAIAEVDGTVTGTGERTLCCRD